MKIEQVSTVWSGSLHIGLTTLAISDSTPVNTIPSSALTLTSKLTWIVTGSEVRKSGVVMKENYAPALERLEVGLKYILMNSSNLNPLCNFVFPKINGLWFCYKSLCFSTLLQQKCEHFNTFCRKCLQSFVKTYSFHINLPL